MPCMLYFNTSWTVEFHPDYEAEFDTLSRHTKTAIAAKARLLEEFGPATRTAACRYPRRFETRKDEGAAVHCG